MPFLPRTSAPGFCPVVHLIPVSMIFYPNPWRASQGSAQTTSLQYGVAHSMGQVFSGSSQAGGPFKVQGLLNRDFPTDFQPLDMSNVREFCLSEAHSVPPLFCTSNHNALGSMLGQMSRLETLVLARQTMVGHVPFMIDKDYLRHYPRILLPPLAISTLVQLVNQRKTNTRTSDISYVEIKAFKHELELLPDVVQELKMSEEIMAMVKMFDI